MRFIVLKSEAPASGEARLKCNLKTYLARLCLLVEKTAHREVDRQIKKKTDRGHKKNSSRSFVQC